MATGANAEYGRTAGGVVNVITKSGTNQVKGSLFYFQRLEGLTSQCVRWQAAHGLSSRAIRRHGRRTDARRIGCSSSPRSRGSRRICSGRTCRCRSARRARSSNPTLAANEALINGSADCQRLALLSFFKTRRNQDEGQPVTTPSTTPRCWRRRIGTVEPANNLSVSYNFDSFEQHESDVRRRDLWHIGERHRRAVEDQHAEPEPVQHADLEQAERASHHLFAREPAAVGHAVGDSRRHRHRVRAVVPIRQPVLPRAERRRAGQAVSGEGQLLDRHRQAHDQDRRRMDAHEQHAGLPRLLRGPVPVRQRDRLPALHLAGGPGRIRSADGRLLRTAPTSPRRPAARPARRRPAARCCSICRAAARTASRATRRERPTSTTTKWRSSSRTSGRPGHGLTLDYGLRWDAQADAGDGRSARPRHMRRS